VVSCHISMLPPLPQGMQCRIDLLCGTAQLECMFFASKPCSVIVYVHAMPAFLVSSRPCVSQGAVCMTFWGWARAQSPRTAVCGGGGLCLTRPGRLLTLGCLHTSTPACPCTFMRNVIALAGNMQNAWGIEACVCSRKLCHRLALAVVLI